MLLKGKTRGRAFASCNGKNAFFPSEKLLAKAIFDWSIVSHRAGPRTASGAARPPRPDDAT
jgi:hypothetical protein